MALVRGFSWEAAESIQVVYQTPDGDIHEVSSSSGAWAHANLSALTGTSGAGAVLRAAYEWPGGGSKQVVYTQAPDKQPGSFNQHVHELYRVGAGSWHHADLTAISSTPTSVSPPLNGPQRRRSTSCTSEWEDTSTNARSIGSARGLRQTKNPSRTC